MLIYYVENLFKYIYLNKALSALMKCKCSRIFYILDKPVTASGQYSSSNRPQYAVDASYTSLFISNLIKTPWLIIDLEVRHIIVGLWFYNWNANTGICGYRQINYSSFWCSDLMKSLLQHHNICLKKLRD